MLQTTAPCKAILFGEHYVVYGSPALSIPIEPRNTVQFTKRLEPGIALHSQRGEGIVFADGRYEGTSEIELYAEVVREIFVKRNLPMPACSVKFTPPWDLKGVGTSSSFCSAFAKGLYKMAGKNATPEEIFIAAQAGDSLAHGGRASGIDARTVTVGKPIVFQKTFAPEKFSFALTQFALPKDSALLIVDTFAGERDGTKKMLRNFAASFGITQTPSEISEEKRAEVREEYAALWKKIEKAMKNSTAKEFGALMNENHALLRKRNVSSEGIERAISSALKFGAYGAKLSGGGGEGGIVLVLCDKEKLPEISGEIRKETGFAVHALTLAKNGAGLA